MIYTIPMAIKELKKKFPDVSVKEVFLYDPSHWLFCAPTKGLKVDYNDPYYLVDIFSGDVRSFSPVLDYENFAKAISNGPIKNWQVAIP